ncbi:MAG: hypothetical protein KBG84_10480, partial [Planctomycetes bacterium]|nr:hypothetical protein [Planctomycetota bacterium]
MSEGETSARKSTRRTTRRVFKAYKPQDGTYDELFGQDGVPRPEFAKIVDIIDSMGTGEFRARQKLADAAFLKGGITFS